MISFQDMATALVLAVVLALVVIVAALLAEGRAQHLLRFIQAKLSGNAADQGFLETRVERDTNEWDLVAGLNSPTREEDGEHTPGVKDIVELKDRIPEVKRSLPALKDLPVLNVLGAPQEPLGLETTGTRTAHDTASR